MHKDLILFSRAVGAVLKVTLGKTLSEQGSQNTLFVRVHSLLEPGIKASIPWGWLIIGF